MEPSQTEAGCRLYLITPPALEPRAFAGALEAALGAGDVACLQLRLKAVDDGTVDGGAVDDETVLRAAAELMPLCHARDVALIVNDRPDLAAAAGADGVHIGQQDADFASARQAMGADAIVGVTCHDSRHLAMAAAEAGADYVAFGAFFESATKAPKSRTEPEILAWWSEIFEIPCVAIGGITVANCAPLVAAGADFLAVSAGVWDFAQGPAAAVAAFTDEIARALAKSG
ncbi:MAG: thiamine phosphate synthase [Alphaproteobacteria bacterium]|nr:thiamine phosphate synthase [Alphaproteobacteria bacterium]